MDARELRALREAYTQIYEPQELTEEVEIATEYFYEMGLNENGIDILIEELGEEEFVNWVYDIAEEYSLSEADQTRLQKMAAAKGKIVTGPKGSRPQSTTKSAIQKMGGTTKKISSSQRLGSTISAKRQNAASTAVSQQAPTSSTSQQTKGGIGKAIGGAFNWAKQKAQTDIQQTRKGLQNLGQAWQKASDTKAAGLARGAIVAGSKAIEKHGPAVGRAAGRAAGRAYMAGRELRKSLNREEYEYILEHLLDEGYANSIENAEKIVMNMSEEWVLDVLDEVKGYGGHIDPQTGKPTGRRSSSQQAHATHWRNRQQGKDVPDPRRSKFYSGGSKGSTTGYHQGEPPEDFAKNQNPDLAMTPANRMKARATALRARGEGKRANKIDAVRNRPNMNGEN